MAHLKPAEILDATIATAKVKSESPASRLVILGILAGAYIALAGAGANMASFYFSTYYEFAGFSKLAGSVIFPAGLIMVVLGGAELFTGNNLMFTGILDKKITAGAMLRNWIIVYFANFAGSLLIAFLVAKSGLLETGDGLLGETCMNIANAKVSIPFGQALIRGILCNMLVCLAVWMATGAKDTIGKIFAIFFPIMLFVLSGYEHSIANMFFIPVAMFYDPASSVSVSSFLAGNLLPVTIGNIIGGSLFAGAAYYYAYKSK